MKKIIVILIAVAMLIFVGYRALRNYQAKQAAMIRKVPEKVVPVRTGKPIWQEIVDKIKTQGNIQADADIILYSRVGGKIERNLVRLGTWVKPGMVVAVVNRDEIGYQYNPFEVKSDVKGVVSRVLQNPGTMITPSTPLFSLVDIDDVKAVVNVDERKIRFVKPGLGAVVTVQAYPGEVFNARVANISPVCNPQNRTIEVELTLQNSQHRLKPGMYAEAEMTESSRKSLALPMAAVVERLGIKYVFTVRDGRAHLLPVTVGEIIGDAVEILSGVSGDQPVVISGADKLEENDRVTVAAEATQGEKPL